MSSHTVIIEWNRHGNLFTDQRYSRDHTWHFDGGMTVHASSSPHVVPVPLSNPAHVDPEEAFVAAVSSCHMLWFLSLAAAKGYVVERYLDSAQGIMERNRHGKLWVANIILSPVISFTGAEIPDQAAVDLLHHTAHEACFIANSVKSEITLQGTWRHQG